MDAGFLLAFTTGLFGGFGHCIGMCGPIAGSWTLSNRSAFGISITASIMPHLLYNTGRIFTYAFVGGLMGLTGSFVNVAGAFAGIQNMVSLVAGSMMVIMGMNITGLAGSSRWIEQHNAGVLAHAGRILSSRSPARFLLLGLVFGLLPCGLSYTVFIAAAASGGPVKGALTALLFGIGTVPAMAVFGITIVSIGSVLRGRIYRAAGAVVMIAGAYFLFKGIQSYAGL